MTSDYNSLRQIWPMPTNPRPIIIIGAGGIVHDAHLPAYHKYDLPVAGIFDLNRDKAQALADHYRIKTVFDTLDDAFASGTNVVYDVALPPQALGEVLPKLPEGATALIQKPLGVYADEAHALANVLAARKVTAALNFQLRFTPSTVAIDDALEREWFGTITDVEVRVAVKTPWEEWSFMKGMRHVELPLHSIHYLDWIRARFGMPKAAFARSLPHPDYPDRADARSSIILDYGDMLRCCLTLNHLHKWGPEHESAELRIEGTEGAAIAGLGYLLNYPEGAPETLDMIRAGDRWRSVPLEGGRVPDSFAAVMANLQRYVAGEDKVLLTDLASSVETMELVDACMRSSDAGKAMAVAATDTDAAAPTKASEDSFRG